MLRRLASERSGVLTLLATTVAVICIGAYGVQRQLATRALQSELRSYQDAMRSLAAGAAVRPVIPSPVDPRSADPRPADPTNAAPAPSLVHDLAVNEASRTRRTGTAPTAARTTSADSAAVAPVESVTRAEPGAGATARRAFLPLYKAPTPEVRGVVWGGGGSRLLVGRAGALSSIAEGEQWGEWLVIHIGRDLVILGATTPPAEFAWSVTNCQAIGGTLR